MDDDLVVATTSPSIPNIHYVFVVTIIPSGKVLSLRLRDICEPDGNSIELTSLSLKALYAAVNKKLTDLHVTSISHSLSDPSRHITNDDQLQKVLAFEGEYTKLFRLYLNPTPQAFVNHNPHEQNLHSKVPNPQGITMISPPTIICQPTSSILSHAAAKVPDARSKKHGQPDRPNGQGATKKLKDSAKTIIDIIDDNNDEGEEPANVKANTSISKDVANGNCPPIEDQEDNDAAEIDCDANAETMSFAQKSTLFQQSL